MISPNIILLWLSTNASIPTGFSRETSLDSKYIKVSASATDPNDTGGNTTHTHTSPNHSHTVLAHTHSSNNTGDSIQEADDPHTDSTGSCLPNGNHHHGYSYSAINSSSTSTSAVTYSAFSNDPSYYEVIFIKATSYTFIPNDAGVFWLEASDPLDTDFRKCDGSLSTPNLTDKYLKGAGTSADAGSTGGLTTNTHTIAHTHTTYHVHRDISDYPSNGTIAGGCGGNNKDSCGRDHRHYIQSNNATITSGSNSSIGAQVETVEPAYKKLRVYQNKSGGNRLTKNIIGLWLGSLASIPVGWDLITTYYEKYLKVTNTAGDIGNTGGSNTHTHVAEAHNHTVGAHTHTGSDNAVSGGGTGNNQRGTGGAVTHRYWTPNAGQHSVSTSSSGSGTTSTDNTTANSSSNEPEYRTVALIQYKFSVGGAILHLAN